MKARKATSVTQVYPKWNKDKQWMAVDHYEVGKLAPVPPYGHEKVLDITATFSPGLMVEVEFEDYGSILLTEFITELRFQNEDYVEIRNKKIAARKSKDSSGEPQGSDQN